MMFLMSFLSSHTWAQVPDQGDPKLTYRLNTGGNWIAGNLSQLQFNVNGALQYNTERYGHDLIVNGYRFWTQLPGTDELTRLGDDLVATTVPFYYAREKIPLMGFAHYSYSQLHQIDGRVMAGALVGYTPVRTKTRLSRSGLGVFYERTAYPSSDFNLNVSHNDTVRSIPRLGIVSTGWYRPEKSPLRLGFLTWLFLNPFEPEDFRAHLDGNVAVHVAGPVSVQFNVNATYNSVVVVGVQTYDTRATFGLNFAPPPKS